MTGTVLIRPVGEDEREAWNPLWAGYLTFYKTALARDVSDLTWSRFHDPDEPMFALGGYVDGNLAGFAHYPLSSFDLGSPAILLSGRSVYRRGRARPRAWTCTDRSRYDRARAADASRVYWLTQSSNTQARALYDGVADNLGFIQYRKVL